MSEQDQAAPAAKAGNAVNRPKKLVPRVAPVSPPAPAAKTTASVPKAKPARAQAATVPAAAKAKPAPGKPSKVEATVARHQQVLAEALVEAQSINYEQPDVAKGRKAAKTEKPVKSKKPKLVRDSYAMPDNEYAQIGELKRRLAAAGTEVKKSELLRAGVAVLAAMSEQELKVVVGRVERIKTGRPAK